MDWRKRTPVGILFFAAFIVAEASIALAQPATTLPNAFQSTMTDLEDLLLRIGTVVGTLMIVVEAVGWISAQNPQERENAKRGIIYVLIGLILLKSSENLVNFLLETI